MTRSTAHTTSPRLFLDAPLSRGAHIPQTREQAHYLRDVLRRATGDPVRLFNGLDGEWAARVTFSGKIAGFDVDENIRAQSPEPGPWLVFALLKRDATDLVVRQAVELGASRILPVITARTNAAQVNERRLTAIAIEAAEQSERLTVPDIARLMKLESALTTWPSGRRLFAALERTDAAPLTPASGDTALLIGPEGGFTDAERTLLSRLDFIAPISFGPRILRAETAAAAGLALLSG